MAPNSWAVICLWRRFFQLREEEQEQHIEVIARALEQEIDEREDCPIGCEEVVQARREYLREYYRQVLATSSSSRTTTVTTTGAGSGALTPYLVQAQTAQEARRRLSQPNLAIPIGKNGTDSVYLAQ